MKKIFFILVTIIASTLGASAEDIRLKPNENAKIPAMGITVWCEAGDGSPANNQNQPTCDTMRSTPSCHGQTIGTRCRTLVDAKLGVCVQERLGAWGIVCGCVPTR
jgi:hypothetical protein